MGVKPINSFEEYNQIITSGKPVLIDFWAEWCGPCKMISPKFDALSDTCEGVEFYKVDIDAQTKIAEELQISAIPTFMLFKDGEMVKNTRGARVEPLEALVKDAASLI